MRSWLLVANLFPIYCLWISYLGNIFVWTKQSMFFIFYLTQKCKPTLSTHVSHFLRLFIKVAWNTFHVDILWSLNLEFKWELGISTLAHLWPYLLSPQLLHVSWSACLVARFLERKNCDTGPDLAFPALQGPGFLTWPSWVAGHAWSKALGS